jgi:hypothetical protein
VLGLFSLIFMMFCSPENPRWLLVKGKHAEAISAFNKIASFNGSENRIEPDAIFVEFEEIEVQKDASVLSELSKLVESEKTVPFVKSTRLTIVLLLVASAQMFFVLYITLFNLTSVPGNTLFAGMTFGLAESSSNLLSSYICTKIKDNHAFSFYCLLMITSQTIFFLVCGG